MWGVDIVDISPGEDTAEIETTGASVLIESTHDVKSIDFTGSVETINEDKQKVKVIVSIFGRPTPIELDFFQVELEK